MIQVRFVVELVSHLMVEKANSRMSHVNFCQECTEPFVET